MRIAFLTLLLSVLAGVSAAQDTNFAAGPQYLITTGNTMFLHPIATPSLSLDAPLPAIPSLPDIGPEVRDQPYIPSPALQNQPDLFPIYYGYPAVPVVELAATDAFRPAPPSMSDVGFAEITDAKSIRELGYGLSVGEVASFWKIHRQQASRVYTNADVHPVHQS
jgi:hypothetical protein